MTAVSARSFVAAGVVAAAAAVAVTPMPSTAPTSIPEASAAVELSAALTNIVQQPVASQIVPLPTNAITNAYDALEPWAAYGAELAQWALGFVPGLWWVAPGIDLAYFSIEPWVQASVFSVSYVFTGEWSSIGPAFSNALQESTQNFVNYGYAWLNSLVPLPPFPPFPPLPGAAVKSPAGPAATHRQSVRAAAVDAVVEAPATEVAVIPPVAATTPSLTAAASRAGVRASRTGDPAPAPAAASADPSSVSESTAASDPGAKAPSRPSHRAARSAN